MKIDDELELEELELEFEPGDAAQAAIITARANRVPRAIMLIFIIFPLLIFYVLNAGKQLSPGYFSVYNNNTEIN